MNYFEARSGVYEIINSTNGKGGKGVPKSAEHNAKNRAAQIKHHALKLAARGAEDVI